MSEERKPVLPWIAALLVAMPVLHVASFGPACWITSRTGFYSARLPRIYRPIIWVRDNGPEFLGDGFDRYSRFGAADGWM